jgi:hypothetical protein
VVVPHEEVVEVAAVGEGALGRLLAVEQRREVDAVHAGRRRHTRE